MDGNNHPIDSSPQPVIDRLDAYWLRLPLLVPYENSLGTLSDFDVILVSVSDASGRTGWGEACPVKGYSPEDPAQAWQYAGKLLPKFKGMTGSDILRHLDEWFVTCPFLVSAISEA
ncbi:MAG TPA: hypothetical protein DCG04_03095, partial [Rhodospirillaceae bacterium]|nr:hypothetical protein [Rhodospirillaceae bacterium]